MQKVENKFNDRTHAIIGCAMRVHSEIGNGFQEVIYQRALAIEFQYNNLEYHREMEMSIYYRDQHIGTRRVDFFVDNAIMVEIKAVSEIKPEHIAQCINYTEAYKVKTGLLINFGTTSLTFKRLFNGKIK